MGNKQSLNPIIPLFKEKEWEQIETEQSDHLQYGFYRTLRHVETGDLIDQYQVAYADEQDYREYLHSFVYRLRESEIVKTLYLKECHEQTYCSKTFIAKVYIQHIDTRLIDITDIPYPQNLYVALCALEGYTKLYKNLHYFRVEENQICVDSLGHVRVWLNPDLSKNYPNFDEEIERGDEIYMVEQIMRIITQNTDEDSQPESLKQYFLEHGQRATFEQAKFIIMEYARKHNANIPQCFESILEIYNKKLGGTSNNVDNQSNNSQDINQIENINQNSHYPIGNPSATSPLVNHNRYPNVPQVGRTPTTNQFYYPEKHKMHDNSKIRQYQVGYNSQHDRNYNSTSNLRASPEQLSYYNPQFISQPYNHSPLSRNHQYTMPKPYSVPSQPRYVTYPQYSTALGYQPFSNPYRPYAQNSGSSFRPFQPGRIEFTIKTKNPERIIPKLVTQQQQIITTPEDKELERQQYPKYEDVQINILPPTKQQSLIIQRSKSSKKQKTIHFEDFEKQIISRKNSNNDFKENILDISKNSSSKHQKKNKKRDSDSDQQFSKEKEFVNTIIRQTLSIYHKKQQSKYLDQTYYYTADAQEYLDPEIAADLKKMFPDL